MVWAAASLQTTAEGKDWSEPAPSNWTRAAGLSIESEIKAQN